MVSTHGEALLQAVIESPGDDVPRLVYADWLDEHGEAARGEFIRRQCELEQLPPESPRRTELEGRCDDLLAEHEESWLGPVPDCLEGWTFGRGFVDAITVRDEPSPEPCSGLFQRHPIRWAHLLCGGMAALRLTRSPWYERLDDLCLTLTGEDEEFLAGARGRADFPAVTELCDLDCGVIEEPLMLRELPFAPSFRNLELMAWGDHPEGLGGLRRLLAGGAFPELTELAVMYGEEPADLTPLMEGGWRDRWLGLNLWGPLSWEGLRQLARCGRLERLTLRWGWGAELPPAAPLELAPGLTELFVTDRTTAGSLLPALARSSGLERLRSLRLRLGWIGQPCSLSPGDFAALGEILARLRSPVLQLELYGCPEGTLRELLRLGSLDHLASLSLQEDAVVGEAELPSLVAGPLTGLRCLRLPVARVSAAGIRLLADASWLDGLSRLSLIEGEVHQDGLEALLESPRLRRLTCLELYGVYGAGCPEVLANWAGLRRLREMEVGFRCGRAADVRPFLQSPHLSPLLRLRLGAWFQEGGERLRPQELEGLRARFGCRVKLFGDLPH